MYAITAQVETYQGKRYTFVSQKKWASYNDARKNLENYIETIPTDTIPGCYLIGSYISEEEDES